MHSTFILISGKAEAGKTTLANYIVDVINSYHYIASRESFADMVKSIAYDLGWDGVKDEKGRRLLQVIGTEAGRAYDQDTWARFLYENCVEVSENTACEFIVVDDWRFPNEADYLSRQPDTSVFCIRIERPGHVNSLTNEQQNHDSELSLPSLTYDDVPFLDEQNLYQVVVFNDGDLELLQDMAQEIAYRLTKSVAEHYITGEC